MSESLDISTFCTLLKRIFCMQFSSYDIGSYIFSLKVVCIF